MGEEEIRRRDEDREGSVSRKPNRKRRAVSGKALKTMEMDWKKETEAEGKS